MSNENETKIWAMANQLRGTMDASQYKDYIFAFMFYRFLSEYQENYLRENNLLNDFTQELSSEDLAEYLMDISSTLGYAIKPADTWSNLTEKVENNQIEPSIFQQIFDHFNENSELNEAAANDFKGIFSDVNLADSRLGSGTASRAKSLSAIVTLVNEIEYKDEAGHDKLGGIYEYLIGQFAASAGKKGGEFYTPHEVSQTLAKIVTTNNNYTGQFTVYDPAMGSGSLLLTVQNELGKGQDSVEFYGQELNTSTYNLARMNLMMHGVKYSNMTLSNADTLEADWPDGEVNGVDKPRSFDAIVANPPYSAKWDNKETRLKDPRFNKYGKLAPASKADYAFILHSLYHLNNTGTMAIVLPHGVLFRGAAEGAIRQQIIKDNQLDAVIGLPANLFYGTSIPTAVLVFKKNKNNSDVLFIDASNDFDKQKNQNVLRKEDIDKIVEAYKTREDVEKYAHLATFEEIASNDFNLNIPRYVDTFEEEEPIDIVALSDDFVKLNQKIAENEKEFLKMLDELAVTEESKAIIEATKRIFGGD